jgi:hypothetical protein
MHPEEARLSETRERKAHWYRWGPFLSDRAWGTVREDYSRDGSAWDYFPHDHARSRVYRWNEDGLLGWCDNHQRMCFGLSLWNGVDPILKERLFGLAGPEGNHGEDVKEIYYFQDALPSGAYAKATYRYPHREFPYGLLTQEGRRRGKEDPEFEIWDSGAFDGGWFDATVEYAKNGPDDVLIRVVATNHGPRARLRLLPTLWFRNTWSFEPKEQKPSLDLDPAPIGRSVVHARHASLGDYWWVIEGADEVLFCDNETNRERLFGVANETPHPKDAFHRYVVEGRKSAVNPEKRGTKAAALFDVELDAGEAREFRMRLLSGGAPAEPFGIPFDAIVEERRAEADTFYERLAPASVGDDARAVQRQAFAGLVWSKSFYHYDVRRWLNGDPGHPTPPPERREGRNAHWRHLHNEDVLLMPDSWEYPWYAAWDLAFHCIPYALIDSDFAKSQLLLLLREWYMHPNGQIPAYEWAFGDVNPPVHAWAAWRVYKIEKRLRGTGDVNFLKRAFHKLLLNFNWWINRKDLDGRNVFEGGFLGLDNIGVFDRSAKLPPGVRLEQSDATAWMGMFCLNMLAIAKELAQHDRAYEDVASKFFEHFVYIASAMNRGAESGEDLWDETDGFFYDALRFEDGRRAPLKVRSMVGLIPLFAVETIEPWMLERLPGFTRRMMWFIREREDLRRHIDRRKLDGGRERRMLALVPRDRLVRVLKIMLDENEFLSPYGVRSVSRIHAEKPYVVRLDEFGGGREYRVDYDPGESRTGMFGGNSNWRGPVWFPVNYLLIEALQRFHYYLGDDFKVECPTGSGRMMSLWGVAAELSHRLVRLFLQDGAGRRPCNGPLNRFADRPEWRDNLLFHEYFHGDDGRGLGANHQTGWTALVAKLVLQSGV